MDLPSSSKDANRSKFRSSQDKKKSHASNKKAQKDNKQQDTKKSSSNSQKSTDSDEVVGKLSQPKCRFADIDNDSDEGNYNEAKSFKELLEAPVSTSSFMFKHEKNWEWTESPFSNHFSLDLDNLAKIFKSIPFNEYVSVEDKYLTKDDITFINSSAELARKEYLEELKAKKELEKSQASENSSENKESSSDNEVEDELDFLLSLKEPVRTLPTKIAASDSKNNEDVKPKTTTAPTKSMDLEKWLDSVIDD